MDANLTFSPTYRKQRREMVTAIGQPAGDSQTSGLPKITGQSV